MSTENHDSELTRLYRNAAREQSPAWLDVRILEAAERHARSRRLHRRMRLLAAAAAVAGLAIAVPRWQTSHDGNGTGQALSTIGQHSPLAEALRNLRVERVETSVVAGCLQRIDLCSNDGIHSN